MRFAPVAALILSLFVVMISNQPTTTSAAGNRSISGSVFFDTNKNGQFDFGELPAPGRTVELNRFDRADTLVAETKSDAKGYYHFDNIPSDIVLINVKVRTNSQSWCVTGDPAGKTVPPGSVVNLGVLARTGGSATGSFTNDLNENGVHDPGEPPLEGWRMDVWEVSTPNVLCYSGSTTGPDGTFRLAIDFDRSNIFLLSPPSSLDVPWEWTAPILDDVTPDFPGEMWQPTAISKGDKLDVMIHFLTGNASLSGTVFRDLDKDGVEDGAEPFVDCRRIRGPLKLAHRVPGLGGIVVNTTPTCYNGVFKFTHLEAGDYFIKEDAFLRLTEYYTPSPGAWVTIQDGQHVRNFLIPLTPSEYPNPSATPVPSPPPPPPVQFQRRLPDVSIIMPPAGSQGDESSCASAALLLATAGIVSIFAAALLKRARPRRN